jgi:putative acetyltransferase
LTHSGEISLLLPNKSAGNSVGQELLSALLDLADNWLNLKRLEIALPTFSTDLAALLNRYGFEAEGVMKKSIWFDEDFHDEIALVRLRDLDKNHPAKRPAFSSSDRKPAKLDPISVIIRQMADQDIDDLYQMFSSPENCRTTLQLPSLELWVTRQRVLQPPPGILRLVAVYDERVIGVISLMPRPELCRSHIGRIGMMVHPDFWGQGIGSRLMTEILRLADEMLGLKRVELQVHTDNPAGIRLYEKSGFTIEGTKYFQNYGAGGWVDTHFMAHLIE